MFIAILGRQPAISLAELEAVYGVAQVRQVSAQVATVVTDTIDLSALGGTTKIGKVITTLPLKRLRDADLFTDVSKDIVHHHIDAWRGVNHKITLGISAYNLDVPPRLVQKTGLILKSALKKHSVSLRLVPNDDTALSTAVSHNNKLGLSDNKVELMVVKTGTDIIIAESRGAQNITAYARRDHGKPKRDAFVGMLPPKLAQIMLNLALGTAAVEHPADPHFSLLHYHLDLFDQWQPQLGRPYETLKRFFKIYIRDFDGAKELRDQLMHTKDTSEARALLSDSQR